MEQGQLVNCESTEDNSAHQLLFNDQSVFQPGQSSALQHTPQPHTIPASNIQSTNPNETNSAFGHTMEGKYPANTEAPKENEATKLLSKPMIEPFEGYKFIHRK
jgi:hypothetical protein